MRIFGLKIGYEDGVNYFGDEHYPVGELPCRIFQGETLNSISSKLIHCINICPMNNRLLSPDIIQDEIEDAEDFVFQALQYDDFIPAQHLAQGCFIRIAEHYRAVDSTTKKRLLQQEIDRAEQNDLLNTEIGFDTVGNFMRLCFNNYLVDLINALSLFTGISAQQSGTANTAEQALYDDVCLQLNYEGAVPSIEMQTHYDPDSGHFSHHYIISSFLSLIVFEFSHLKDSGDRIMRCKNPECCKFFISRRTSAKYCSFPAPQKPDQPCKAYYPQLVHQTKVKGDELKRLEKNAKCRLYNYRRRNPRYADEIRRLLNELNLDTEEKRKSVLNGDLSLSEFKDWLDSLRIERKVL